MASSFGVTTDLFAVGDTYSHPQSSETSKNGSTAQCLDSQGTIVAETNYDTGLTYSEDLTVCKGGSHTPAKIGDVTSNKVITSASFDRSNSDALKVNYGGESTVMTDTQMPKFTIDIDSAYLVGGKGALAAGIIVTKGKVISSSIKVTSSVARVLDSQGVRKCESIYGARMEATNELQSCDTAPAAVADTANGWKLAPSGGGPKQSNTAYPTTTFVAYKALTQDT